MANFKVFLLVCAVIAGVCGSGDKIDPEPNRLSSTSIPPQPTPTSTPTPSTSSTTTPTTTTSATTTTVSPAPPITTTTTTTAKTTITTAKPTSTPTPTPAPVEPKVANWTVNYANSNRSCIILFVAAQIEILDLTSNKTIKVNVPVNATASGSCEGKKEQTLTVSWGQNNSLALTFEKNNSSKFDLKNIVSTINDSTASGSKVYNLIHNRTEFSTPLENSYKCGHQQTLNFTQANSNATAGYLHVSHLQYQAFRNSTEHKFDSALDCESSVTPDVVPIVVGCVLAVLVVAVLAAYLFGRRRCQARGYLSM